MKSGAAKLVVVASAIGWKRTEEMNRIEEVTSPEHERPGAQVFEIGERGSVPARNGWNHQQEDEVRDPNDFDRRHGGHKKFAVTSEHARNTVDVRMIPSPRTG
jgi:hypothetical protein